uniref:Uncharacterized protein n=1 Tax=Podoviridae sp. ctlpi2 TaxID=2826574 RepID=A0A8S5MLN3_9CAUD|nr:MAG TPA: hypothetical protein [Podoviridae sp. ctlpi2]
MKVIERKKPLWAFVFGEGDEGRSGLVSCVGDVVADGAGEASVEFTGEDGRTAVVRAFGQTQVLGVGYAWLAAPGYSLVVPLDVLEQECQDAEKDSTGSEAGGGEGGDPGMGSRIATLETQVRILQAAVETMRGGKAGNGAGGKGSKAESAAGSSSEASAAVESSEPVDSTGANDKEGGV